MKPKIFFLLLLLIGFNISGQSPVSNLLPVPANINIKSGLLRINEILKIKIIGKAKDEILQRSALRLADKILKKSGNAVHSVIFNNEISNDSANIIVQVDKAEAMQIGLDESYKISVSERQVILKANNSIGAIRGMETLVQLLRSDANSNYFPEVEITDFPRFKWRGLMIDCARHFIPTDVLMRNIEAMAEVKMNVLHLHLSDNEGFRVESKMYPELQAKGSNGKYYLQKELKDLVSYAADRGIIIVPEFDMPGHSRSWFAGYPELASAPGPYKPGPGYSMDPANPVSPGNLLKFIKAFPTPAMDPSNEATYSFLNTFLSEVCDIFPSAYIHIGVDENNGVSWRNNSRIVDFMSRNGMTSTDELQSYFADRVNTIVTKHGRISIGWDEIYSPSISKNVLIQIWDTRAPKTKSVEILQHGNSEINSRGYYLDLFMPAYVHYLNDPMPYNCPDSLKKLVLGGEAAIWTELANEQNIEGRIWPRTAAIAERLWAPASVENVNDLYKRLFEINLSLAQQGLQHIEIYRKRIEKLAGNGNSESLKTLMDVLSPVKGYKRVMAQFFSKTAKNEPSELNEVADIANVDPEMRRQFRMQVASYLNKPSIKKEKELRDILYSWSKNHGRIDSLLKSNPRLNDIIIHSKNLSELARIGIKALDFLHMNTKPPLNWSSDKLAVIRAASESHAEVELSIVPEIEALVRQKLTPEQKGGQLF